jgi:hypothetical protein
LGIVSLADLRNHRSVGGIQIRELALSGHEAAVNIILD